MTEVRNFTVIERTSEPTKDDYGNWSYFVKLEGVDKSALLKHKGEKPVKNPGDVIEGYYLEEKKSNAGNVYYKLTRPQQQGSGGGGGGGSRPKDPAERESIERQVAAKCATDLLVGFMGTGWAPTTVNDLATQHQALAKQIAQEIKKV